MIFFAIFIHEWEYEILRPSSLILGVFIWLLPTASDKRDKRRPNE